MSRVGHRGSIEMFYVVVAFLGCAYGETVMISYVFLFDFGAVDDS